MPSVRIALKSMRKFELDHAEMVGLADYLYDQKAKHPQHLEQMAVNLMKKYRLFKQKIAAPRVGNDDGGNSASH